MRTLTITVATVAALMVCGACGTSGGNAQADPTPSPTEQTPSAPPKMPRAAHDDTDSGAIAFVKYYVDVLNYTAVTGDTDQLSNLSASDCEGCQEYIELYKSVYNDGGYFKGGEWSLDNIEVAEAGSQVRVFAHMKASSVKYRSDSDADVKHGQRDEAELVFEYADKAITKLVRNEQ